MDILLYYLIFILIQILIFVTHAYFEKRLADIPKLLIQGICIGSIAGLAFDIVFGKLLGYFSYGLGFGAYSLLLNAIVLYGLFTADILLLQKVRLTHFYCWVILVATIYEIVNLYLSVWTWEVSLPLIGFLIFLFVGYTAFSVLIAITSHLFGRRFTFISKLLTV